MFGVLCVEVAELKAKLCQLDKDVFSSLPKEGRTQNYWQSTEKIMEIVTLKKEVCKVLNIKIVTGFIMG